MEMVGAKPLPDFLCKLTLSILSQAEPSRQLCCLPKGQLIRRHIIYGIMTPGISLGPLG